MCKATSRRKTEISRVGTLNSRGIKQPEKQADLANDMHTYKLDICAIQETHITETDMHTITSQQGKTYYLYTGKSEDRHHGVGFMIDSKLNAAFNPVSSRICYLKIKKGSKNYTVISAYAPTLPKSEKTPEIREKFYEELESVLNTISNRDMVIITGDFNAKTGSEHRNYPENMGRYGKGMANTNGEHLLEFARRNNLILTNTTFKHKLTHRTTWTGTKPANRRNPVRNQIDYILVRRNHRIFVNDSRSYSGTTTHSDHKIVIADMEINWHMKTPDIKSKTNKQTAVEKLHEEKYSTEYKDILLQKITELDITNITNPQEKWNSIVESCKSSSLEVLGHREKHKTNTRSETDTKIKSMSTEQKKIRNDIHASTDHKTRKNLQSKRNEIMRKIHKELQNKRQEHIVRSIAEIEACKDDSTKMYKAIRNMVRDKPNKIIVKTTEGITCNDTQATDTITEFFEQMFYKENEDIYTDIKPMQMQQPFTATEVKTAIRSLKNNKSPGVDNLTAEELKHSPNIMHQHIADLINTIAETGKYPSELNEGILIPIQKPGKPKGPVENLRPVILLTLLRKIIAISMLNRIGDKLDKNIPVSQAAYRRGRGTTEQVFTMKILAEKAITANDYAINILLMDMSKAFDTVKRGKLIEQLKDILQPDELHLILLLIKDISLQVRYNGTLGKNFKTNIGVPQGDGLSPILFTLYLAKALSYEHINTVTTDHTYTEKYKSRTKPYENILPSHLEDHTYSSYKSGFTLDQQYADDVSWISTEDKTIKMIKDTVPNKLKEHNLNTNPTKDEEYKITRNGSEEWKQCKYLGSYIHTERDIKSRKCKAMAAYTHYKHILTDRKLDMKTRMRVFNAYVTSVFMYNTEIWTINKKTEHTIDVFQRNLYRMMLKIKWPHTIHNTELYKRCNAEPWSTQIARRRLTWVGHLHRLNHDTPARIALDEATEYYKRTAGGQQTTWIKAVNKELQTLNIPNMNTQQTHNIASNRKLWNAETKRGSAMSTNDV